MYEKKLFNKHSELHKNPNNTTFKNEIKELERITNEYKRIKFEFQNLN